MPITETGLAEQVVEGSGTVVRRTKSSLSALLAAAAEEEVLFAGASGGGYVFPEFLPAYDAVMSTGKVLELVARSERRLSQLVCGLPRSSRVHHELHCPWSLKGTTMRRLIEAVKGLEVDHMDGIKVYENGGWVQILPDPDEPVFHIYAEGRNDEESEELERRYRETLESLVTEQPVEV